MGRGVAKRPVGARDVVESASIANLIGDQLEVEPVVHPSRHLAVEHARRGRRLGVDVFVGRAAAPRADAADGIKGLPVPRTGERLEPGLTRRVEVEVTGVDDARPLADRIGIGADRAGLHISLRLVGGARRCLVVAGVHIEVGGRVIADGPELIAHRLPGLAGSAGSRPNLLLADQRHRRRVVDGDGASRSGRARVHRRSQVGRSRSDGVEQGRVGGAGRGNRRGLLQDQHVDCPGEAPLRRRVHPTKHRVHAGPRPEGGGVAVVDVVVDNPQLGGGRGRPPKRREHDDNGENATHGESPNPAGKRFRARTT